MLHSKKKIIVSCSPPVFNVTFFCLRVSFGGGLLFWDKYLPHVLFRCHFVMEADGVESSKYI